MNDARLALLADLNQKQRELAEVKREKQHLNMRKKELRRRGAPQDMLMRYDLDIMERTNQINQLNEQIFAMKNGW